ncbi:MAG: hypothetical protein AB7O57_14830 [Hyphomicrobiaceae bacterium]
MHPLEIARNTVVLGLLFGQPLLWWLIAGEGLEIATLQAFGICAAVGLPLALASGLWRRRREQRARQKLERGRSSA